MMQGATMSDALKAGDRVMASPIISKQMGIVVAVTTELPGWEQHYKVWFPSKKIRGEVWIIYHADLERVEGEGGE